MRLKSHTPEVVSLILSAILLFYCEIYTYSTQARYWKYAYLACQESNTCVKVIAIANPKVLGDFWHPWTFTRWDADRYLRSSYSSMVQAMKPDVVTILGDLIDEGFNGNEQTIARYHERFDSIFDSNLVPLIALAGDTDIGGHGQWDMQEFHKVHRFQKWKQEVNNQTSLHGIEFVTVNTLAFTAKKKNAETIKPANMFLDSYAPLNDFTIFLSHMPLEKLSDTRRETLMDKISPDLILAGHSEESTESIVVHREEKTVQWVAPTFSYKTSYARNGFIAILIDTKTQEYTVTENWMSERQPSLELYKFWLGCLAAVAAYRLFSSYYGQNRRPIKTHRQSH
ncbi:hypothetical protein SARC_10565 [Sphaeroforma arctica JP610]|uniref:Calcineurin-like phosphoesterase domain-containing protein n=1 Tax=Sphaeroforma arctica JP610 TaxID=667725 RepID=A0A0L0FJL9_9EUKA|nr:hypothetical protein SARC_10565 [Sphaeroforma arctica JP610]KNC76960.1 hypothetical protein SARC_10565 [Sphaeroforma arctica JP610]|eukprot:XP_014150862.1 hypothetical protein SARC_10565 [Sphaeroforma arctica JP610]